MTSEAGWNRVVAPTWLRFEGLAILLLSLVAYTGSGAGWLLFPLVLLVPDLTMAGYAMGPRAGAAVYNAGHTYAAPLLLAAIGGAADFSQVTPFVFIWTAHIGLDRMLGYGLKSPSGFRDTHLGRIGRD